MRPSLSLKGNDETLKDEGFELAKELFLSGTREFERGNLIAAETHLSESLNLVPNRESTKHNLALVYAALAEELIIVAKVSEAAEQLRKSLDLWTDNPIAWCNLGCALENLGQRGEAIRALERAVELDPGYMSAWSNLGSVLFDEGRPDEALACFQQAVGIEPSSPVSQIKLSATLNALGRPAEAAKALERVLSESPESPELLSSYARTLRSLNRHKEAIATLDRLLSICPEDADAHWDRAFSQLALGDFLDGWADLEWRWQRKDRFIRPREFSQPLWLGDHPLEGKRVLLHGEQGFGDVIQFVRYATLVKELGADVVLEVYLSLRELVQNSFPDLRVIVRGEELPNFDFHCPLMTLPLAFRTTLESVPSPECYLVTPEESAVRWRDRLGKKLRPRIGLVWSGRDTHGNDAKRSMPAKLLTALMTDEYEFHSLQKDVRASDQGALESLGIKQWDRYLLDFSDTAALCQLMDVIVSVDTSVAHLSGALGKRTLILLPFASEYRWLTDRTDSPWYPTASLFRQKLDGDWPEILTRIRQALPTYLRSDGSGDG